MAPTITGLNHITLAVSDVRRAITFYQTVLGCALKAEWPEGAYLEAGGLWLCLSYDAAARKAPHPDYSHIAFSVTPEDFAILGERIEAQCEIWKANTSEGNSIYFLDPDGHKLELHIGTLASRLDSYRNEPSKLVRIF